jgi:serine/threonine-protein kinase
MVLVAAGEFQMGGVKGDLNAEPDEKPSRSVDLGAFYIDKFEITNALYRVCVDVGSCKPPVQNDSYTRRKYYGNPDFDQYPVVYVDWNRANAYCEWRGSRLPTEAEWEKAARGTDARIFPWEGKDTACQTVNYRECFNGTTKVGSLENGRSPYGAYDMAGNVWEWVQDWYSESYYQNSLPIDPFGPDSGQAKVLRGGSWSSGEDDIRTSQRRRYPPRISNFDLGFRCAQDAIP